MNNRRVNQSRTRGHSKARRHRSHKRHSSDEHPHNNSAEAHSEPAGRIRRKHHTGSARTDTSHDHYRQPASSSNAWDVSIQRRINHHQRPSSSDIPGRTRHRPPASSSRAAAASSCLSSQSTQQSASETRASDIPGYYYDEATKLYFKMQSYNLGTVAPFITRDKIASQQKENQRVVDVQNFTKQYLPVSAAPSLQGTAHKRKNHLVNVLQNVQCGQLTIENMRAYMFRHMCSRLEPDVRWENSLPGQQSLHLGEIQNMEVSKHRDKIACVSSLKSSYSQIIQLMTVGEQSKHPEGKRSVPKVTVPFLGYGPIHKRIKTMCWAPVKDRHDQATILYTTVCPMGCLASIAYLSNLEAENYEEQNLFELNLGKNIIWSAAWNTNAHQFTIGAERRCYLIDVATRRQWTFSTIDSDPLSQLFPVASPYIYNGTRKGHILLHDVRAPEKGRCSLIMKQAPGIGCLRLLKDENYLLASDFSGKICTWDQRMRKTVMEYTGLVNSHWQLPFHTDETETVLTSTGSDSYTKIWDMKTGQVLRSIPPPYPVSCESFPLSFYSTRWGRKDGNNALLLAMRNSFSFYTYKETVQ